MGLSCGFQWVVWFAGVVWFGFGLGLRFWVARVLLIVPDQSILVPFLRPTFSPKFALSILSITPVLVNNISPIFQLLLIIINKIYKEYETSCFKSIFLLCLLPFCTSGGTSAFQVCLGQKATHCTSVAVFLLPKCPPRGE